MKYVNQMPDGNKNSLFNFGLHGWITILYCLLMFWFYVGMVNDGSNATAPAAAARIGVENGIIMSMNSIAGVVGVLFFIVIGKLDSKIGPSKLSGLLLIIAGISYTVMGSAKTIATYTVAMCFVVGTIMSAGYISGGNLVAQWFPKKRVL